MKLISAGIAAGIALILSLAFWPLASVPTGHTGIVTVFGKVQDRPLDPGLNWVGFFAHSHDFNTQQYTAEHQAATPSKDMQTIHTHIKITLHAIPGTSPSLYSEVGDSYYDRLILPSLDSRILSVITQYTAEEMVTKQAEIQTRIASGIGDAVRKSTANRVAVDSVVVTKVGYEGAFAQAILAKQVSEQQAQKARYDLEKAQVDAKQAIAVGDAQAAAFKSQSRELTPQMLQMEWIKKWDGKLPQYTLGGGNSGAMMLLSPGNK